MSFALLHLVLLGFGDFCFDAEGLRHPHFQKKVEVVLPGGEQKDPLKLSVTHLTATFDEKGFLEMPPGKGWHLANAHLQVSAPVKIGGQAIEAGTYRLLARKTAEGPWELVIDGDAKFSSRFSDQAKALKTEFKTEQVPREHLNIDLHPSGEKDQTVLFLEVHFHQTLARCRIEVP